MNNTAARNKRHKQKKVLLMGRSGAGKSSMRKVIFKNFLAKDVRRLGATVDIERDEIKFLGNLELFLWDCGGQDSFVKDYMTTRRSSVFASVAVLIFVFDLSSGDAAPDMLSFTSTIRALREFSPSSKVFVLLHKMDLIPPASKVEAYESKVKEICSAGEQEGFSSKQIECCPSSIWDQSIYRAWTKVIYYLVPNADVIEGMLRKLAELLEAYEMILYERTTCLVVTKITRSSETRNPYTDRFERISSILKAHRHSMASHTGMMTSETSFAELQIKTGAFMFFIARLTGNTNLAVVMPSDEALFNSARLNVQLVKHKFAHLDIVEKKGHETQEPIAPTEVAVAHTMNAATDQVPVLQDG